MSQRERPALVERDLVREVARKTARRIGPLTACLLAGGALLVTSLVPVARGGEAIASPAAVVQDEPSPVELVDTPEATLEGKPALRIRVLDAATDEPVPAFLAVAGVEVRDDFVDAEFLARHGANAIVNWQPHTAREGVDGELLWPMARMYQPLGLRVEAAGYLPRRQTWIDKDRGAQTITFRLRADPGTRGRVVLPDGAPAAGAEVGIRMTSRGLVAKGPSLGYGTPRPGDHRDRWRSGVVVVADELGHFHLPTETDPSAIVVAVHEGGITQVAFEDLARRGALTLRGWGRVEGTVRIGAEPTADETVRIYETHRAGAPYPEPFTYYAELKSGPAGRFVIEHFPPGSGQIALPDYIPVHDPRTQPFSHTPPIPENAMGNFHVRSGETTRITIGGEGLGPRRLDRNESADEDD